MAADAPDVLLEARGLGRRFRTGGLRGADLVLRRGDVLGLLGLNGAGKSTLLGLLAGTLAPDVGSVTVAGYPLEDEPLEARARLGYLPDPPPLYPDMRVDAYLGFCARLRRVARDALGDAVDRVIARCALGDVRRRRIGALSKGYRQRVGLAQALVHEPQVLLLDEPGSGLDPQQGEAMRGVIADAARGGCVVLSTHLPHELRGVCNRVAVLHEGRLVAERAADDAGLDALFARLARGAAPAANDAGRADAADAAATTAAGGADRRETEAP